MARLVLQGVRDDGTDCATEDECECSAHDCEVALVNCICSAELCGVGA